LSGLFYHLGLERADSLLVNTLDKGREYISLGIGSSGSEQDVVRVPIDRQDGRPDGLFDVLGYPPVVLFIEGADSNSPDISRYPLLFT
jgi:hypothetical protein